MFCTRVAGPDHYRQADISTELALGDYSLNTYLGLSDGDGYRKNNEIEQRNLVTELRRRGDSGDLFLKLGVDDQELNLPGGRYVVAGQGSNELRVDPRGADTQFDWADQDGFSVSVGGTRHLSEGVELIADVGLRQKHQDAWYLGLGSFLDTDLLTASITPRLKLDYQLGGRDARSLVGIDYYQADYDSDRQGGRHSPPINRYRAEQRTAAIYAQNTVALGENTDLSFGLRGQYLGFHGEDDLDVLAPGYSEWWHTEEQSLRRDELEYAFNAGIEHRATDRLSVFGRVGRGFRLPTIDERIGGKGGPSLSLDTQTSIDAEVGARWTAGPLDVEASLYGMDLKDELYYRPDVGDWGANDNLDPTRRLGVETNASFQVTGDLRLRGALSYTHAEFIDGPYDGEEIPLVSPWTASASAFWNIQSLVGDFFDELQLVTTATYVDEKRLGDDPSQAPTGAIPRYTLVDARLTGAWGPITFSLAANNLFDVDYFEIGYGFYDFFSGAPVSYVYPLPGRTLLFSIGTRF